MSLKANPHCWLPNALTAVLPQCELPVKTSQQVWTRHQQHHPANSLPADITSSQAATGGLAHPCPVLESHSAHHWTGRVGAFLLHCEVLNYFLSAVPDLPIRHLIQGHFSSNFKATFHLNIALIKAFQLLCSRLLTTSHL